jgi:hypothetical protein
MPPVGDASGMMLPSAPTTVSVDREEFVAKKAQVILGGTIFSPSEQEQLHAFREKLQRCVAAFEKVNELLDSEDSGLPDAKDLVRCRLGEDSFSIQDARRELKNEWLSQKIHKYVKYVDAALTDEVSGTPALKERRTPEREKGSMTPSRSTTARGDKTPLTPDQRASVANELPSVPKFQPFIL